MIYVITVNVLWIRHCRHALGELAGSRRRTLCRRTLLHMQQPAAEGRHGRHRESFSHLRNSTQSIDVYLLEEQ